MSQMPINTREGQKKDQAKVYKSIVPTALTTTRAPIAAVTTGVSTTSNSTQPLQKNVPAFLNKLYSMVNDPESDDLICWADDGMSFFVNRQEEFARKVLPRFFKHNKFSSFVRQLNMYGFHKVPHLQQGVLETDSDHERWEFSNPHFQRNQPDLLLLVTRKKGTTATTGTGSGSHDGEKDISSLDLQHILEEIQSIKKHQMNISTQLQNIQRDNQVLWNETVQARERHLRHQETIDKILRFLASVFSNGEKRHVIPRKRRFLLESGHDSNDSSNIDEELTTQSHEDTDNASSTIRDSGRPAKVPRQQQSSASSGSSIFNLDDFVDGRNDPSQLSTVLPAHLKDNALSSTSSDLDDAIALNNQAKNETATLTTIPDLSTIANIDISSIPQLQNLQTLITLAQANPDLLNQLSTEQFFSLPSSSLQAKQASGLATNQPQAIMQPTASISTINSGLSTPASTTITAPYISSAATPTNTAPSQSNVLPSASAASINGPPTASAPAAKDQLTRHYAAASTPSLNQVTNNLSSIASSAESLNEDIDQLGLSLEALADHLGFDPSKLLTGGETDAASLGQTDSSKAAAAVGDGDGVDTGDLINMDDFLNTYGSDMPEIGSSDGTPGTPSAPASAPSDASNVAAAKEN